MGSNSGITMGLCLLPFFSLSSLANVDSTGLELGLLNTIYSTYVDLPGLEYMEVPYPDFCAVCVSTIIYILFYKVRF